MRWPWRWPQKWSWRWSWNWPVIKRRSVIKWRSVIQTVVPWHAQYLFPVWNIGWRNWDHSFWYDLMGGGLWMVSISTFKYIFTTKKYQIEFFPDFIIPMTQTSSLHAHWPSMYFCTLLIALPWLVQCGHTGLFWWSAIVATLFGLSRATNFHIQISAIITTMLHWFLPLHWYTISTWCLLNCSLMQKDFLLLNVCQWYSCWNTNGFFKIQSVSYLLQTSLQVSPIALQARFLSVLRHNTTWMLQLHENIYHSNCLSGGKSATWMAVITCMLVISCPSQRKTKMHHICM